MNNCNKLSSFRTVQMDFFQRNGMQVSRMGSAQARAQAHAQASAHSSSGFGCQSWTSFPARLCGEKPKVNQLEHRPNLRNVLEHRQRHVWLDRYSLTMIDRVQFKQNVQWQQRSKCDD